MFFKHDINIFIYTKILNKTKGQTLVKSQRCHTFKYGGSMYPRQPTIGAI
jgi:hypothetical protein